MNNKPHRPITKELVEAYGLGEYWRCFKNKDAMTCYAKVFEYGMAPDVHIIIDEGYGDWDLYEDYITNSFSFNRVSDAIPLCNKINDMLADARNAPVKATPLVQRMLQEVPELYFKTEYTTGGFVFGTTPQAKLFLQQFTLGGEQIDEQ